MVDEGADRVAVVVEDDADIRNLLEAVLSNAGFEVHTASDGLAGVEAVRRYEPVVTTLDISLPGIDGFEVARRIRTFSSAYIVMLTARDDEIDTLVGLDAGADDYLTKPFRPRELRARIEAMLRRPRDAASTAASAVAGAVATDAAVPTPSDATAAAARLASGEVTVSGFPVPPATAADAPPTLAAAAAAAAADPDWLEHDGLRLSPTMRLVERDGERIDVTRSEFELLQAIMENDRRVVSKAALATAIRAEDYATGGFVSDSERRTVEVHLANLRRKLGESSTNPRWIETVRGVGYRLAG